MDNRNSSIVRHSDKLHVSSQKAYRSLQSSSIPHQAMAEAETGGMVGRRGIPSLLSPEKDDGQERIASDVIQLVGWTPLVELKQIMKKDGVHGRLVAKIESYQPLSSVKDRSALRIIEDAEEKGLIAPGITTLVEPTSGNFGIGLAYIAIRKGYKFVAVMPAKYSLDKQMILRYLGADLYVTVPVDNEQNLMFSEMLFYQARHDTETLLDYELGFQGQLDKVEQLKHNDPNMYFLNQVANPANVEAHFIGTGPEIWKDTAGKVDIFVCGAGSGGTVTGTGKYLKMKNPSVQIICVEPEESQAISGGCIGPHKIQGLGPGFVPPILDMSYIDEVLTVTSEEAMDQARRIAREEGLLVGISSGASLAACLKVAKRVENYGKMIVTVFPSNGERYTNSDLFAEVREECINMNF